MSTKARHFSTLLTIKVSARALAARSIATERSAELCAELGAREREERPGEGELGSAVLFKGGFLRFSHQTSSHGGVRERSSNRRGVGKGVCGRAARGLLDSRRKSLGCAHSDDRFGKVAAVTPRG